MKKRLFLLCAAIAALTAVSCGSAAEAGPVSEPDSSAASEQESRQEETEEPTSVVYDIPEPELPEMDYGGESFLVYTNCTQNESSPDLLFPPAKFLFSEGLNGEIVNDTVFNRNLAVEQKFNIKFNFIQKATLPDILIAAGEPFDLVMSVSNSISERIDTGAYLNMYGFPYLSLDAEYWFPSAVDGFLVDDLLYFLPCDISMDHLAATGFFYFNKRILAEHDLPNPYELVYSDNWTLDTFLEMVKQVHGDLNGDGVMDMEDLYGCLHKGEWGDAVFFQFYFGSGLTYTKWDPNEGRVLNFNAEKAQGIIDKLWDTLEDRNFCLSDEVISRITSTSHWDSELYRKMFAEGHALLIQDYIEAMDTYRDMEDDFGILPNPKYDNDQKDYYHRVRPSAVSFALPTTLQDEEKAGVILEYWAWLSHYTLLPAYYEITIKQKRTRDEDAVQMLDIIRTTRMIEFADVFYSWIQHYVWYAWQDHSFPNRVMSNQKMFSKRIAKYVKALRAAAD